MYYVYLIRSASVPQQRYVGPSWNQKPKPSGETDGRGLSPAKNRVRQQDPSSLHAACKLLVPFNGPDRGWLKMVPIF
jgi:hypothetical protein